jgi:hypothetical protein
MKTMMLAAVAALVAVARMASADTTGSPEPAGAEAARAAAEARALLATIQSDARVAREALEIARARGRRSEVRCADESLSRADVALRAAREDETEVDGAVAARRWAAVLPALERVRRRAAASHEARVLAMTCSATAATALPNDRTLVTLRIDPGVPRVGAGAL